MTGAGLIAVERVRQTSEEGWTPEHDDKHTNEELANAATDYIDVAAIIAHGFKDYHRAPFGWPFEKEAWKPSPDPIRNLVKAGALIAAEIDRLQRKKEREEAK
jgi:hypothetical protein